MAEVHCAGAFVLWRSGLVWSSVRGERWIEKGEKGWRKKEGGKERRRRREKFYNLLPPGPRPPYEFFLEFMLVEHPTRGQGFGTEVSGEGGEE